ncbi:Formate--tetrahydrofolate ligase [Alkaliphilus peptidifermentans DSM 18978]|uniref:Formate--tetrahydrofolate ligase n=1 Tax=Alkaliphilus peptidifermentans DSM 18978 TaxID=1120976 RepID=A0A1G5JS03_9FIRM|nr:Formate--tetrahydrofolate ligase [Alkaliphilus peptidifermentans DSM 18978]
MSDVWANGGTGGTEMAYKVVEVAEGKSNKFKTLYDENESIKGKIIKIATEIYGADGVDFSKTA